MTPRILAATLVVAAGVSTVPTGLAQTRPGAGGAEQNKVLLDLLNQVENSGRQLREKTKAAKNKKPYKKDKMNN